jgi:hypothetical protein
MGKKKKKISKDIYICFKQFGFQLNLADAVVAKTKQKSGNDIATNNV